MNDIASEVVASSDDSTKVKQRDIGAVVHVVSALLMPFSLGISILIPAFLYFYNNHEYGGGERDEFMIGHFREALNANVTFLLAVVVHGILTLILIGFLTVIVHWVCLLSWSFSAQSALKAGHPYRYPLTVRIF